MIRQGGGMVDAPAETRAGAVNKPRADNSSAGMAALAGSSPAPDTRSAAFTPPECTVCGLRCSVGVSCVQKIGGRWIKWRLCKACWVREERNMTLSHEWGIDR